MLKKIYIYIFMTVNLCFTNFIIYHFKVIPYT